jgi:hypothetical protein
MVAMVLSRDCPMSSPVRLIQASIRAAVQSPVPVKLPDQLWAARGEYNVALARAED